MLITHIIGARPQFIKAAAVSREIAKYPEIEEKIVHTGQHFDANMSEIFFQQMKIPEPDYNLEVNSLSHGAMTARMLHKIEKVLLSERPDWVVVYGDTNSTLAGALAAKKLHIKVAHVEAGLRSFNRRMPEEINRILTDKISDLLLCPTDSAVRNLQNEGIGSDHLTEIFKSGDVMQDAAIFYSQFAKKPDLHIPEKFILATMHRAENTDYPQRLNSIFKAFEKLAEIMPIILPLHPRTKKILPEELKKIADLKMISPVGYLEMIYLLQNCELVMTDSGGLQKEAFFFQKQCVTLRDETEWVELVENGFNFVVGSQTEKILAAFQELHEHKPDYSLDLYGNGKASKRIVQKILERNS